MSAACAGREAAAACFAPAPGAGREDAAGTAGSRRPGSAAVDTRLGTSPSSATFVCHRASCAGVAVTVPALMSAWQPVHCFSFGGAAPSRPCGTARTRTASRDPGRAASPRAGGRRRRRRRCPRRGRRTLRGRRRPAERRPRGGRAGAASVVAGQARVGALADRRGLRSWPGSARVARDAPLAPAGVQPRQRRVRVRAADQIAVGQVLQDRRDSASYLGRVDSASARSAIATGSLVRTALTTRSVLTAHSRFASRSAAPESCARRAGRRHRAPRPGRRSAARESRVGRAAHLVSRIPGKAPTTSAHAARGCSYSSRCSASEMRSTAGRGVGIAAMAFGFGGGLRTGTGR